MTTQASVAQPAGLIGSSRWAIAANLLTLLRLVLTPILVLMILHQNPWWPSFALGWFLGFTDWFDGRLARHAEPTRFGAFWDPLADKAVVLAAAGALVWIDRWPWLPVAIIAGRELGLIAFRSYWARYGMAVPARTSAKYKTFVQGLAIASATCPPIENTAPLVTDVFLWVAVAFTLWTGWQYVADGRASLRATGTR